MIQIIFIIMITLFFTLILNHAISLKCGGSFTTVQFGPPHGHSLLTRSTTMAAPRFYYYYNFSSGNATMDSYIMKKIVPSATTHFINAITLYSITSSLTLTSTQCGTVPIPSTHNNPGLTNTDIIIYMTLDNTTQSEAVGTGSTCEFDSIQGNPVAGIITINQNNFY